MQKNQLAILRKHGELWSDRDYKSYLSVVYNKKGKHSPFKLKKNKLFKGTHLQDSPLSITFFEERYTVDQRVFKVLEESIESFLHPLSGFSGPGVEEKVSKRIKLYPAIKEIKVKMLCKEMTKLTGDYEELVREKLCLLSTPINEQELISTWYFYLTNQDFEKLIELLKFDIFKGERIESFGYPFIREAPKNTHLLDVYFCKHDKLCLLQEAMSMLENILYLKELINEIEIRDKEPLYNNIADEFFKKPKISQIKAQNNGALKRSQIALIHIYERSSITEENSSSIAAKYGYNSKTSGLQLFRLYCRFTETSNRTGKPTPCTKARLENKIKLFKSIIKQLSLSAKERAKDEIKILESLYEQEYE